MLLIFGLGYTAARIAAAWPGATLGTTRDGRDGSLRFADEAAPRLLTAGDTLLIEPHRRHRVERTESPTIWLAIHFGPEVGAGERP